MNIVEFSEGILGIDRVLPDGRQAREIVAESLRTFRTFDLDILANNLDAGKRTKIEVLREIGDERLHNIRLACQ